ncbi:ABC transporter permease [Acrocarpospora macrocephala]|uniref:Glutathione ABC transporter permease GsiD n=1 Tax=Acrocarpospora macrocephala TaxID=150177 RepID=A0A5M3WJL2_9ACTN|nr:ABC transporter permease [Acrocarpospora macrocephala]GES09367.1 glutathione ABC transporter permease GsiD [Acrocarpospora macrocephala]
MTTKNAATGTATGPEPRSGGPERRLHAGAIRRMVRRFRRQRAPMVALGFLALLVLSVVAAPLISPYDPLEQHLAAVLQGPSAEYWFGTDELGRDLFSRVLDGGRVSLLGAVQALVVGLAIGLPLGLLAGYFSGVTDMIVMRFTDALMSFPPLVMMLAIVAALGPNLTNAMLALGVVFAPRFIRLVRGVVLALREEPYIEAARSIGVAAPSIIVRHIIPNALPPLIVQVSLATGFAILAEASLSFLGLGVQPPQASWGSMLSQGFSSLGQSPTMIVFPGVAIALTVLACNVVGDGLRESIGREVRSE